MDARGATAPSQVLVLRSTRDALRVGWSRGADERLRVVREAMVQGPRYGAPRLAAAERAQAMMTQEEYEAYKARIRAEPGWRPNGHPDCGDCCTMSHCETHFKIEETYPEWVTRGSTSAPPEKP